MSLQSLNQIFSQSLIEIWEKLITFLPILLIAIIVFTIGCFVASVIGKALHQVISLTKVDKILEGSNENSFMKRAGFKFSLSKLIGCFVKWFIIVVFFIASLKILGLHVANFFLSEIVITFLPKVIVVLIVLIIATILADALKKFIVMSARGAKISSANILGTIAYYSIWIFASIVVLFELGVASEFIQIIFIAIMASLALALGLAFGLGGRDTASRLLEKATKDLSNKE